MEHGVAGEQSRFHTVINSVSSPPLVISFSKPVWVKLNRFRIDVGLFCSETHKWGMASTAACECGAKKQTAEYVMTSCPIYHHPNRARAVLNVNKNLVTSLMETYLAIK